MAKLKITKIVSDISGEEINGNGATVTISTDDGKRFVADVLTSEIAQLLSVATETKKPGRKAV